VAPVVGLVGTGHCEEAQGQSGGARLGQRASNMALIGTALDGVDGRRRRRSATRLSGDSRCYGDLRRRRRTGERRPAQHEQTVA
jgi:hypothetical protein